jgi:Domain of unknown function (DUF3846)
MKQIGTLYRAEGGIETVTPHDGKKFTLTELQGFVGGLIELVPGTGRRGNPQTFCNEEGLLKHLPYNGRATQQFKCHLLGDVIQIRTVR